MSKPKTLLINYHRAGNIRPIPSEAEEELQIYPPLGISYIAAYLREHGYPVEILDAGALDLEIDELEDQIRRAAPAFVGVTATSISWPGAASAAKAAKRALPGVSVVAGGPQLSIFPEESLSFDFIDIGVIGDGEETMLEIVRRMDSGGSLKDIKGTVVKDAGKIKINPPRHYIKDLSSLPSPAVDLLPMGRYHCLTVEKPFFTMVSARGCPYKCGFCTQVHCGDRVRFRSPEDVASEMEKYVKEYGAKEIIMFDETFTVDEARVLEICRLIDVKGLKFRWDVRTRVDTVTDEMLTALKKAGCHSIHMGVESGSPRILDVMKKGVTIGQIKNAFETAKSHGFTTRGYFMIGYLDEDEKTYRETVRLACELPLDYASFSITTPLPATDLFKKAAERGLIDPDYWKNYALLKQPEGDFPFVKSAHWDRDELKKMMRDAYFKFYMRPEMVWRKLWSVRNYKQVGDLLKGLKIIRMMGK